MDFKENKIFVCVAREEETRARMISALLVKKGICRTKSAARQILSATVSDIDLQNVYLVAAHTYSFHGAYITNQRLYELAARGMFVAVGVKSLPREYEIICRAYYE